MKLTKKRLQAIIVEETSKLNKKTVKRHTQINEAEYPSDRGSTMAEEGVIMALKNLIDSLGAIPDAFDRRMVAMDAVEQIESYANAIEE
jgi:hypothetical protein